MKLSHGKVASCPFSDQSIAALKRQVVSDKEQVGLHLSRNTQDSRDVSIDNMVLDTEDFSGARMPRLPALQKPRKKWRLAEQGEPLDSLEGEQIG